MCYLYWVLFCFCFRSGWNEWMNEWVIISWLAAAAAACENWKLNWTYLFVNISKRESFIWVVVADLILFLYRNGLFGFVLKEVDDEKKRKEKGGMAVGMKEVGCGEALLEVSEGKASRNGSLIWSWRKRVTEGGGSVLFCSGLVPVGSSELLPTSQGINVACCF